MKGMEVVENKNFIQDCWFSGSGSNYGSSEKWRYECESYESVKSTKQGKTVPVYVMKAHKSVKYSSAHSSLRQ